MLSPIGKAAALGFADVLGFEDTDGLADADTEGAADTDGFELIEGIADADTDGVIDKEGLVEIDPSSVNGLLPIGNEGDDDRLGYSDGLADVMVGEILGDSVGSSQSGRRQTKSPSEAGLPPLVVSSSPFVNLTSTKLFVTLSVSMESTDQQPS